MNGWSEQGIKRLPMEDFLEPLSVEEVEELAVRSPDIPLTRGEEFYRQDQHNGGLFFIKCGRVQVQAEPSGQAAHARRVVFGDGAHRTPDVEPVRPGPRALRSRFHKASGSGASRPQET
jgi:hypothetical protein